MLAVAAVAVGCGDQDDDGQAGTGSVAGPAEESVEVPAQEVLRRDPYVGVSCPEPNTYACDRVGLAVWLEEPAVRVDAAIAGRELELDDPEWSGAAERGQRTMFAGFLQPAGLVDGPIALTDDDGPGRWIGREPVVAPVELEVTDPDGGTTTTRVDVTLSAGWG